MLNLYVFFSYIYPVKNFIESENDYGLFMIYFTEKNTAKPSIYFVFQYLNALCMKIIMMNGISKYLTRSSTWNINILKGASLLILSYQGAV